MQALYGSVTCGNQCPHLQARRPGDQCAPQHTLQLRLAEEVEIFHCCLAWLEQLGGNTIAHSGA